MMNHNPSVIARRKKNRDHTQHHGGAWKVAYADFVTAMMAFFLLMWLLNATDEHQRRGISNYFSPISNTGGEAGSSGIFGGKTIKSEGQMEDISAYAFTGPNFGLSEKNSDEVSKEKVATEAKHVLHAALPKDLEKFASQIRVDMTSEGLQIQIIDKEDAPMFPPGSAIMYDHTIKLLNAIYSVISKTTQKIAIYGHTDSTPYQNDFEYGNWELSSDRAHATRRILIDAGLDSSRIEKVAGKADQDPLNKENLLSPQNRRINIILMKA